MNASPSTVSVIMRSKNSAWVIGQALAALYSQERQDFELLVVDSGSTDNTLDIVRQYPCRLIEIPARDYYPGEVLNRAIEQTTGEIVVFQNSDAVPLIPQTLDRLLKPFDDHQVQATFCRQIVRPEAVSWVRRDYATAFPDAADTPEWLPYSLPMAAMRRTIWKQHPFYTDAWGSEDSDWGHWARTNGHQVCYVANALVMHSHNYTLRQIYGRKFIEGEADAFIYSRPETLRQIAVQTLVRSARDVIQSRPTSMLKELFAAPLRNAVSSWAHYQGHRLGCRRQATGNLDTSIGQQAVLDRYEPK